MSNESGELYIGYFADRYGEQWIFTCDRPTGVASLRGADAYLARYTHRIAISNDRSVCLHDGQVTFRWKDRAHGDDPPVRHTGGAR